jgi:transcriptional regulator with XRE-family HTH domain
MKIPDLHGDEAVLQEMGMRFARTRLEMNLTQEEVARSAGVSKRTVERLEAGHSVQLAHFLRICRALGLLDRFDALIPAPVPSPMELLRFHGKERKRASGARESSTPSAPWRWGEDVGGEKDEA